MTMLPEPTDVMPTRKPATRPMSDIHANDLMVGGFGCSAVLDLLLEEQECWNANQQDPDANGDEVIDAVAIEISQVNQQTHAEIRAGSAADDQCQHHLALNRAFAQMDHTGADLSREVEKCVRSNRAHCRHVQTEDENREQQNAAPDPSHSDEGPDKKTHKALDQQIHDSTGFSRSSLIPDSGIIGAD